MDKNNLREVTKMAKRAGSGISGMKMVKKKEQDFTQIINFQRVSTLNGTRMVLCCVPCIRTLVCHISN